MFTILYSARRTAWAFLIGLAVLWSACDVFATRAPEDPEREGGTYLQPDTPERVVENLKYAVAELNTQNYRRSFSESLVFTPSASAEAGNQNLWLNWSQGDEDRYFSTLVAAAQQTTGNELRLTDQTLSILTPEQYVLDATYLLTVQHRRPGVPATVQGRLIWLMVQENDGLWRIAEWTDRELAGEPSWSDLKAEFIQ